METNSTEKENDWTIPDKDGNINIPDELDKVFNSIGMQFNFVKFSGKNEVQAIAHIVQGTQKFFKEFYEKQHKERIDHALKAQAELTQAYEEKIKILEAKLNAQ